MTHYNELMKLWPFQRDAIRTYDELSKCNKRIVLTLPTGGGKTIVAAAIIAKRLRQKKRALFLAMRREQIEQAFDKLVQYGVSPDKMGTILADEAIVRSNPSAPIQIASLMTLLRRNLKQDEMPGADVLVIDECHHSVAKSYEAVLKLYPEAEVLGLTATPMRYDGRGLNDAGFEAIVVGATTMQLGAAGYLTLPRIWGIANRELVDLKGIKIDAYGDFAKGEAASRMSRPEIIGCHVEHYEKYGVGRSAVVYACTIEHAKSIGVRFSIAGHEVEYLFGPDHTSNRERERILTRLQKGERVVVVNVEVLTEGWDCPAAKVCIVARPTRSWTLHMQMIGRFLRPCGAVTPTILDHVGNIIRHGMPDAEFEFRLVMPKLTLAESKISKAKECKACGAVCALGVKECFSCGAEFLIRKTPSEIDGALTEYTGASREKLLWIAKSRGYHPGWVDWSLKRMGR